MTGFNEVFLIDTQTRGPMVEADPSCTEIIKPYLRGQDIDRWAPEWAGLWMILSSQRDLLGLVMPVLMQKMFFAIPQVNSG